MAYRRTDQVSDRLEARRRAILRAARQAVADTGFHAFSMRDVADRSGVAIGTLYRYFPSKEGLCSEVVTGVSERELALLAAIAESGGPPLDRLRVAIVGFSRRAMQAPTLAYALMAEPAGPDLDRLRLRYRERIAGVLAGLIEACVAERVLPVQSPDTTAALMVGAFIEGVIGPQAPRLAPGDRDDLAAGIAAFCLRGAGAP